MKIKEDTGNPVRITEKPLKYGLRKVELSKQQLIDVSNAQYLAYLAATGKKNTVPNSLGIKKAEEDMMPRFRLKKRNNKYYGRLPETGALQLTGKYPHYEKFLKKNRKVNEDQAYSNMAKGDAREVRKSIKRIGRDFLDQ